MQMLTIEGVSKVIRNKRILDEVSLGVEQGEIVGLLGPSGAGKSTLIKICSGLVMPTSGDVYIGGISLYRDFEKCMRMTGAVLERPEFYPYMTGYENLRAIAYYRGGVKQARIDKVIDMMKLDDYIDEKVSAYPSGVLKRLAIAAAILPSPRLLLLDEAIDELDPIAFLSLRRVLKRMAEQGTAIIMTSHQMSELERTCGKVAVIEDGLLIGVSTVEHLKRFGTGKVSQRLMVDRPEAAVRYITEALAIKGEARGGYAVFDCEQSLIPKITAMLFTAGHMVYEARTHEISLEEAYYRLLKEKPMPERDYKHPGEVDFDD